MYVINAPKHLLILAFIILCRFELPVYAQAVKLCPQDQIKHLQKALAFYKNIASTNAWTACPGDVCLRPGDTTQTVLMLRNNLFLTKDLPVISEKTISLFDEDLTNALKKFQRRHGLPEDGIAGVNTLALLNIPPGERVKQIEASLLRWQQQAAITYPLVFVNIPDFTLQLINTDTQTVWKTNVVVGQVGKEFHTATLTSAIKYLIINPSWHVPNSIIRREIAPALKSHPNYLARNHMKLYQSVNGKQVQISPRSVNWNKPNLNNLAIIQQPGRWNALGKVKFIFPNPFDIYLHDTPVKNLFNHPSRAYSHGCVRVQNPEKLASYLLSSDWQNPIAVTKLFQNRKSESAIFLPAPVPVQIAYYSCWIDKEGLIHFRDDIYNLDSGVNKAL